MWILFVFYTSEGSNLNLQILGFYHLNYLCVFFWLSTSNFKLHNSKIYPFNDHISDGETLTYDEVKQFIIPFEADMEKVSKLSPYFNTSKKTN